MGATSLRLLSGVACLVWAATSSAEGVNTGAADALFQKALTEMKEGRLDTACPAFAESQRLDPRPGTLFSQAECEAKWGKAATATTHFNDYIRAARDLPAAQQVKHKERLQIAEDRKKQLAPQIAFVTLTLAPPAPKGAEVRLDDTVLGAPSLGVALPLDPGRHVAILKAASGAEQTTEFTLEKGEKKEIALKGARKAPPPDEPPDEPVASSAPSASAAPPVEAPSNGRRTAAYVVGGISGAVFVMGAVAGVLVLGKKSTVDGHCVDTHCDSVGKDAADSAKPLGLVSNVGLGIGVLGLAAATWLFVTSSPGAGGVAPDAAIGRNGATLSFRGRF